MSTKIKLAVSQASNELIFRRLNHICSSGLLNHCKQTLSFSIQFLPYYFRLELIMQCGLGKKGLLSMYQTLVFLIFIRNF